MTGAAGRIGLATVEHLNELGARVTALSNVEHPDLKADRVLIGDTRSETDVARALEGAEYVVHLAALAHPSAGTPYDVYSINVVSTFNVLAQAGALGIERAVIASSINATGDPVQPARDPAGVLPAGTRRSPADVGDPYSLSKQNDENTARMAWRRWGIDVVAFRFPHVNSAEVLQRQADHAREIRPPDCGRRGATWTRETRRTCDRARADGAVVRGPYVLRRRGHHARAVRDRGRCWTRSRRTCRGCAGSSAARCRST